MCCLLMEQKDTKVAKEIELINVNNVKVYNMVNNTKKKLLSFASLLNGIKK